MKEENQVYTVIWFDKKEDTYFYERFSNLEEAGKYVDDAIEKDLSKRKNQKYVLVHGIIISID